MQYVILGRLQTIHVTLISTFYDIRFIRYSGSTHGTCLPIFKPKKWYHLSDSTTLPTVPPIENHWAVPVRISQKSNTSIALSTKKSSYGHTSSTISTGWTGSTHLFKYSIPANNHRLLPYTPRLSLSSGRRCVASIK